MSRPVLSTATHRLSLQPITHCQRPFSTSRFLFFASSASRNPSLYNANCLHASTRTRPARSALRTLNAFRLAAPAPRHRAAFSSSTVRPSAKVVRNAKNDEEGNPLMVGISARAAERLREITTPTPTKEENPYHHLRITVTSGGCHGFQYMMSLEAASKIDAEEDTVFEADDGPAGEGSGEALVVMDEPSLELLSGSTVDYTMELIGSQFKIVDNPRATSNCGCGTSFDVNG